MSLTISTLPTPPSRSAPAQFSEKCDAFLGALPIFVTEANALADEVETHAGEAAQSVIDAAGQVSLAADQVALAADQVALAADQVALAAGHASDAENSATAAAASAVDAAAAANVTLWVSGTSYNLGDIVWSPADYFTYRRIIAGAGTTDPSLDDTNWALIMPIKKAGTGVITLTATGATNVTLPTSGTLATVADIDLAYSARTSNTVLGVADKGHFINLSGSFTQTFDAAATLGAGWHCYLKTSPNEILTQVYSGALTLGDNVIVNGTFDADSDWTKGADWTISGGKANANSLTTTLTAAVAPLTAGVLYQVSFDAAVTEGGVYAKVGGRNGTTRTASGTYVEYLVAVSTAFAMSGNSVVATDFTGTVDNITAKPLNAATISALTPGARYKLTWSISGYNSGSVGIGVGSQRFGMKSASGTYTHYFTATAAHTDITSYTDSTFDLTLGTITLSSVGWSEITLDPDGDETVDDLTSFKMYPGECRLIMSTGSALKSVVIHPFRAEFAASGTFTTPPGYNKFMGYLWGAGGGGAIGNTSYTGGGGGGGACVPFDLHFQLLGATETVTIGAGGAGRTSSAGNGTSGGNSTFAGVTSYAGSGGLKATGADGPGGGGGGALGAGSGAAGGAPTGSSTSDSGYGGATGTATVGYDSAYGGAGGAGKTTAGNSLYGGGGGGGGANSATTAGGTSRFGGSGGTGGTTGHDGVGFGGGGGGCYGSGTKAGNGADGGMIIWGVA